MSLFPKAKMIPTTEIFRGSPMIRFWDETASVYANGCTAKKFIDSWGRFGGRGGRKWCQPPYTYSRTLDVKF